MLFYAVFFEGSNQQQNCGDGENEKFHDGWFVRALLNAAARYEDVLKGECVN